MDLELQEYIVLRIPIRTREIILKAEAYRPDLVP
jgi:hypothetical protein